MEALLFTYLRTGFFASVMILAVLLLRPLLRKASRNICCVLWLLVAVRLLLPFQLESPLSLQPQLSEPAAVTDWAEDLPATDYEPVTNLSPSIPNEPIQHEAPLTETKIEPETAITILWGCGILAVLLYVCISYGVLRYRVRDAIKCLESVWESDRIGGAFLLGYFQPKIYIPAELNLKDRRFILAHEQSHLKRGDHWWKLLGMVCLSIHWYNPLVWLGYALLCRDIEVACDEHVICDLELEERKSYSFALLSSGKRLSGFLAYPVAFGEISLKQRIKSVLSYRKPGIWITAAAVTLTLTVAVCFMTNPTTAARSQPEEKLSSVQTTEPTTEEPTAPTTEALIPTESETLPPAETTASTEPVTDPTEATVPPTASVIKPTAPPPTKPTVIPTVPPATKPTEPPVTTPTNPPITEPTQPEVTVPPTTAPTQPPVTEPEQSSIGGSCGENVVWEYNEETRQLTIRGSGPMVTDNKPPWEAYKSKILSVSISNGITSISPYAFYNCTELRSISIPGSVATIEERAFCGCAKLQTVRLSEGLQIIGAEAFDDSGIKSIVIPKTVILIESGAFSSCDSLTQITFTGAPPKMEVHTFLWTTATAYYPEYTGTWRSALYDYGGNITWELCCTNHSYINGVCERCGSKKGA